MSDLRHWDEDRALYLFTSLTAGSSHIVTATSRIDTILRNARIPFAYVDTATDESAKKLFQRRAKGKKLPLLVKDGYVIAVSFHRCPAFCANYPAHSGDDLADGDRAPPTQDIEQVEEWNEFGEPQEEAIGPVPTTDKSIVAAPAKKPLGGGSSSAPASADPASASAPNAPHEGAAAATAVAGLAAAAAAGAARISTKKAAAAQPPAEGDEPATLTLPLRTAVPASPESLSGGGPPGAISGAAGAPTPRPPATTRPRGAAARRPEPGGSTAGAPPAAREGRAAGGAGARGQRVVGGVRVVGEDGVVRAGELRPAGDDAPRVEPQPGERRGDQGRGEAPDDPRGGRGGGL